MQTKKGIVIKATAWLLLVYFALAVIPIDCYHNHHILSRTQAHHQQMVQRGPTDGSVSLSSYCLICNIHLDSTYTLVTVSDFKPYARRAIIVHIVKETESLAQLYGCTPCLRGPPRLA